MSKSNGTEARAPTWIFALCVVGVIASVFICGLGMALSTRVTMARLAPAPHAEGPAWGGVRSLQADVEAVPPERVQEIEAMIRGDVAMRSLDLAEKLALAEARRTDKTHDEWIAQVSEGRRFRENALNLVAVVLVCLAIVVPLFVMAFAGQEVGDWVERVLTRRAEIRARALEAQAARDGGTYKTARLERFK